MSQSNPETLAASHALSPHCSGSLNPKVRWSGIVEDARDGR